MKKLLFIFSVFTIINLSVPATSFAATPAPVVSTESSTTKSDEAHAEEAKEQHSEDTGVVGMFGINWKLFLAQLVNFSIILLILWKFVFGPVIKGMQDRTKKIEDSLNNSDRIEKEKIEFEAWKNQEMNKARGEAGLIISEAKNTAETTRQNILDQAKKEQSELVEKTKQQLESEKQKVLSEAKAEIANLVIASTEKILRGKLDSKTDAKLIEESMKGIE